MQLPQVWGRVEPAPGCLISVKALRTAGSLTLTERCGSYTRVVTYSIVAGRAGRWITQAGSVCFSRSHGGLRGVPALPWNSGPVYRPYTAGQAERKLDELLASKLEEAARRAYKRSMALRQEGVRRKPSAKPRPSIGGATDGPTTRCRATRLRTCSSASCRRRCRGRRTAASPVSGTTTLRRRSGSKSGNSSSTTRPSATEPNSGKQTPQTC